MTDLKQQIDELTGIEHQIKYLKARKDKIEAQITKQCAADLENTKYKSIHYAGTDSKLTATNAETLKITYASFLPKIFAKAYKDAVTEKPTYKLSSAATRMIIGLWKGNYIRLSVSEVINQMADVTESEKTQLKKKCKGISYDKDVENILKFTALSERDAKEYAYLIAEAAVWQDFCNLLTVNGVTENADIDEILKEIQSAFVVEDSTKISLAEVK